MPSLRFTIYEILGYFAPGIVAFVALFVYIWAIFFPHNAFLIDFSLTKEAIFAFLFLSYSLGHFIQGITNALPRAEDIVEKSPDSSQLIASAKSRIAGKCGIDTKAFGIRQIVSLAQTWLLHHGKTDDHDVFLYREGFYRGSSAAYFLLAIAFLVRGCRGPIAIVGKEFSCSFGGNLMITLSILAFAISVVFFFRFLRFGNYRVQNLLASACLPTASDLDSGTKDDNETKAQTPK